MKRLVLTVQVRTNIEAHVATDPRCAYYREPRTWLGRWRFDRNRGRACEACEARPWIWGVIP